MDFYTFGDADAYEAYGQSCAAYVQGALGSCYNALRPVGIQLYYGIPYLLSSDPVTIKVLTLLMNILCLWLLVSSCLSLYKSLLAGSGKVYGVLRVGINKVVVSLGVLVLVVGFVPIRSPDLQGAAFFLAAVALLINDRFRDKPFFLIISGLCAGISILLKQNYMVPSFLIVFFWCVLHFRFHIEDRLKSLLFFLSGFSVCVIQMIMVYAHGGFPWFYDAAVMAKDYGVGNLQPYVELIAVTVPVGGAYMTQLAHPLSSIDYVAVKFFAGMYKFYWTIYLGNPPYDISPAVVQYSCGRLNLLIFSMIALLVVSALTYFARNKWIFNIAMTSFLSAFATAVIMHTENRYYVINKIMFLIVFVVVVNLLLDKLIARYGTTSSDH